MEHKTKQVPGESQQHMAGSMNCIDVEMLISIALKTALIYLHSFICMLLQVLNALREVSFLTEIGEKVFFDKNGDPAARYDLLNWQQGEDGTTKFVKVGFYDASLQTEFQLSFNNISIVWAKNQHQVPFYFW